MIRLCGFYYELIKFNSSSAFMIFFLVNQNIEEILKKLLLVVIIFTSKRLEKRVWFSLVKYLGSLNSIVNFIYFLGYVV